MNSGSTPMTLPGWVYRSQDFLELEKESLFRRHWMIVGHACDVPEPGDFLALDIADERVLVIRGDDGELRAFHNVCRHRASRVVVGERGNCGRAITCPYHGWTYALDGSLRGVPARRTFRGMRFDDIRLPAVELEQWHGLLFVRIEAGGTSVAESFAPFETEAAQYPFDMLRPLAAGSFREIVPVNWKCIIDNDSEGYHVPLGHPGLQRLYGETYRDEAFPLGASRSSGWITERPSPAWSERNYQSLLDDLDHLPPELSRMWLYYGLFPCISLGIYPESVGFYAATPIDVDHTLLISQSYAFATDSRELRAAAYLNARINNQVWREDLELVLGMAPGLRSSSFNGGPISDLEPCLEAFHESLRTVLPVARLQTRPEGDLREMNDSLRAGAQQSSTREQQRATT